MSRGPILWTLFRSSCGLALTERNTFLDALWPAEAEVDHWGRFNLKEYNFHTVTFFRDLNYFTFFECAWFEVHGREVQVAAATFSLTNASTLNSNPAT